MMTMFLLVLTSVLAFLLTAWLIAAPLLYKRVFQRGWIDGYKAGFDLNVETVKKMQILLERAGVHFDETYTRAILDESPTRSWTDQPIAPAQKVPPGSVPRWDEVQ